MIDELERLLGAATPRPWNACRDGKCSCHQIWSADHPVAEVASGKWGDEYPSIRLVGPSLNLKAEAYMEQISYGEISVESSEANAALIVALVNAAPRFLAVARCAEAVIKSNISDADGYPLVTVSGARMVELSAALRALKEPT